MANKSKSKSTVTHDNVYSQHLQSRGERDMGRVCDGSRATIPSSTYRPIEEVVPRTAMRTQTSCEYKPGKGNKPGKFVETRYTDDIVHNAQHSMVSLRHPSVTDGFRQRRNEKVAVDNQPDRNRMGLGAPPSPVPIAGRINQSKRRY